MTAARGDGGESLVEILLSVMIMGVAVVGLLTAMGAVATTSGLHARQASQVQYLRTFMQQVTDAPYVPVSTCPPPAYVPPGFVDPNGYQLTAAVTGFGVGNGFSATCSTADTGAQQVTVLVHQLDGRVRDETYVLVKRRPCNSGYTC